MKRTYLEKLSDGGILIGLRDWESLTARSRANMLRTMISHNSEMFSNYTYPDTVVERGDTVVVWLQLQRTMSVTEVERAFANLQSFYERSEN